jgi:hypothetical protein
MPTRHATVTLSAMQHHPLAELFPMMSPDDLDPIVRAMADKGYDPGEPITLYEGMILDGRNRQAAALVAGVVPTFAEYEGDDPLGFVIRRNLHRRHLDESQRAIVAGRIAKMQPGNNQPLGKGSREANLPNENNSLPSQKEAAETLNVSPRSVRAGKKVVEKGEPELIRAVEEGAVSVSDAAKVADRPAKVQRDAVAAVKEGRAKTVAKAAKESTEEAPTEALKDADGVTIPEKAIPAFLAAKSMEATCRDIDRIARDVTELATGPGGRCIRLESVKSQLKDAKGNVWANRPTHVCAYCGGAEPECQVCKGEGWLPKHIWQQAPEISKRTER